MSLHKPVGFTQIIYHVLLAVLHFIVLYGLLIIASVPLLILILYRNVLSVIMQVYYKGRYKLIGSVDGICSLDSYASINAMTLFAYIDGPCDIAELQRRVFNSLTEVKPGGTKPWSKLFYLAVEKLGFLWWEDKSDSFDVTKHVRLFPDECDNTKVYTEIEFLDAISKIGDKMWETGRPKWEILVTPKVLCAETGTIVSVVTGRLSHAYGDGVSLVQIGRNCILDSPPKMVIDPVNPPIPHIPFYFKALLYLQAFFLGPNLLLKFATLKEKHIFIEGPLKGPKYIGHTSTEIPFEMLKRIRKSLNCSTMAVVNSAFCGALQEAAKRKNLPVPQEVTAAQVYAKLPYPDIYPRNYMYEIFDRFPLGIQDPYQRLEAFEQRFKVISRLYYASIVFDVISFLSSLLPAGILQRCFSMAWTSYGLTNIPGIAETSSFNGHPVRKVWGTPPAIAGSRYSMGFGPYNNMCTGGFICEKSAIISSREEFEALIKDFENQLRLLDCKV